MRKVVVVPYDESWVDSFTSVQEELSSILGSAAAAIHHIGSTSVPGLCAKPVIDVLLETPRLDLMDGAAVRLARVGYQARGEYGIPGRRYFSRPEGSSPAVHLHAFATGSEDLSRGLGFRDYLRAHPDAAARYAELKRALADRFASDPASYQAGKSGFISDIERKARQWKPID